MHRNNCGTYIVAGSSEFTPFSFYKNCGSPLENSGGSRERPLVEAVYAYMQKSGEGHHEDIMRAYFRLQVRVVWERIDIALAYLYLNRLATLAPFFLM